MHLTHSGRRLLSLITAGTLAATLPAMALAASPSARATADVTTLRSLLQRVGSHNPSLQSFQARVHINTRMLNFPWFSPKLDGTAYYKKPKAEIVFDRTPSYARGMNKLFSDMGDPENWTKDWNMSFEGLRSVEGRAYYTLVMTKRIRSDQIREALAFVDPATFLVVRMEFHYFNGGSIVMTQNYSDQGQYRLVSSQHAEIRIPHVHAIADAMYSQYRTNVPVADSVFTPASR